MQSVIAASIPSGTGPPSNTRSKFGGALRVNGVSNAILAITTGAATWDATLPVKLSFGAEGGPSTPTFQTTTTALWVRRGGGLTLPAVAAQAFFPWTTGRVMALDRTGFFWTFRTKSGFDNRNAAGTSGTLQLVSPALSTILGILPLPIALTSVLTLQFVPEPGSTLLLAVGMTTLAGLYAVQRRKRRRSGS